MELSERIAKIVELSGMSIPQFSTYVGFKTPQTVRELLKGNTKTLSYQAKEKIADAFPNININWLATGEGEMLKNSNNTISEGDNNITVGGDASNITNNSEKALMLAMSELSEMRKLLAESIAVNKEQSQRFLGIIESLTQK